MQKFKNIMVFVLAVVLAFETLVNLSVRRLSPNKGSFFFFALNTCLFMKGE